jgi:ADP-heptose:LPS heptosyltransferase
MNNLLIHTDCKFYVGSKPCKFHKIDKRLCENCSDYMKYNKRIIIIKLDALGDVLRTTSILPALLEKYQDSHITWITKSKAVNLLINNKHINRILTVENNYLSYILSEAFDIGICLDAENMSASILSIANCKEKMGFVINKHGQLLPANKEAHKWYHLGLNDDLKKNNRESYREIMYHICKLDGKIFKPEYFLNKEEMEYSRIFSDKYNLSKYKKIIGINTGGGSRWECKKWLKEYYIELINKLNNYNNDIGIILFGGEKEIEFNNNIKKVISKPVIDAECNDSISKFAGIINLIDIFLTPDSLGFHLSVALGKYTVVMVGPTSPWELDVHGNGEILFNEELDCVACYNSKCKKNKECMISITPDLVFQKITKKINEISNS